MPRPIAVEIFFETAINVHMPKEEREREVLNKDRFDGEREIALPSVGLHRLDFIFTLFDLLRLPGERKAQMIRPMIKNADGGRSSMTVWHIPATVVHGFQNGHAKEAARTKELTDHTDQHQDQAITQTRCRHRR